MRVTGSDDVEEEEEKTHWYMQSQLTSPDRNAKSRSMGRVSESTEPAPATERQNKI